MAKAETNIQQTTENTVSGVKHPEIKVMLIGNPSTALPAIMKIATALRKAKAAPEEIGAFMAAAGSAAPEDFLAVCQKWVSVQ